MYSRHVRDADPCPEECSDAFRTVARLADLIAPARDPFGSRHRPAEAGT